MILTPDGRDCVEVETDGPASDAAAIGHAAGEDVRARAGVDFFCDWDQREGFTQVLERTGS
jgi:hydroxymethylbilane synthase